MNTITQAPENEQYFSNRMKSFFSTYKIYEILKSCNAYKEKGVPVMELMKFLFAIIFQNKSMYMLMFLGKCEVNFKKDTVYRFKNSISINWQKLTTMLASRIIKNTIEPLKENDTRKVFIIDDSFVERPGSKKVELLAKVYDHASKKFSYGFRMLTLGWSDGNTFLPVNSCMLSTENKKNRINEAKSIDSSSNGKKRRDQAQKKATEVVPELLKKALDHGISADYVLFDTWFSSPKEIRFIRELELHVIAMVKKSSKVYYRYNGEKLSAPQIYRSNNKRRGKSKYLLSVEVEICSDDSVIPAKLVFVRNRSRKKEYLVLVSTDTSLTEEEIIRLYGYRWDIEVFFKTCKSVLKLTTECRSLSYDAICAHTAIVFVRYMFLAVESRKEQDCRTLGPLFCLISDELQGISYEEAYNLMQKLCIKTGETFNLSEKQISSLMEEFLTLLPEIIRKKLSQTAV